METVTKNLVCLDLPDFTHCCGSIEPDQYDLAEAYDRSDRAARVATGIIREAMDAMNLQRNLNSRVRFIRNVVDPKALRIDGWEKVCGYYVWEYDVKVSGEGKKDVLPFAQVWFAVNAGPTQVVTVTE
jgi:hypothetical protein